MVLPRAVNVAMNGSRQEDDSHASGTLRHDGGSGMSACGSDPLGASVAPQDPSHDVSVWAEAIANR